MAHALRTRRLAREFAQEYTLHNLFIGNTLFNGFCLSVLQSEISNRNSNLASS